MFTLETRYTKRNPGAKKFSLTSKNLEEKFTDLKSVKSHNSNNNFEKVSRVSAVDKGINFFQTRQQSQAANIKANNADDINKRVA